MGSLLLFPSTRGLKPVFCAAVFAAFLLFSVHLVAQHRPAASKTVAAKPPVHSAASDVVMNVVATPPEQDVEAEVENTAIVDPEILNLIDRWVDAVKEHDLRKLMSCYAPRLTTYFRKDGVPWPEVRRDKEHFLRIYSEVRNLEVSDIHLERNERGLEATLHKTWDYAGERSFSGEVISRLTFENIAGRWLISAERERLIWERKSPSIHASGLVR